MDSEEGFAVNDFGVSDAPRMLLGGAFKNGDSVKIAPFPSGKEMTSYSPSQEIFKAPTTQAVT